MNKNSQPNAEMPETDRDEALRKQQVELIEEDIRMHEETDETSPLEGAVEHIERVREVGDDEADIKEEVKPKATPKKKSK